MDFLKNTLIKFRNCLRSLFPYNTDSAIELIDALSSNTQATSAVQLTENSSYKRHYTTLVATVSSFYKPRSKQPEECEEQLVEAKKKIQNILCQHIKLDDEPKYHLFAVDVTPNPRPYSKKINDRGFIKANEVVNGGKPVTIGHNYSCVAYLTQEPSWALPIAIDRVPTDKKDTVFGIKQWCDAIKEKNNNFTGKASVAVFDAAYSNAYAISAFNDEQPGDATFIARLSGNRVLQRAFSGKQAKSGHPNYFDKKHPFELKDEKTWGEANQSDTCQWVTKKGKENVVKIQVWQNLRMRGHDGAKIQKTPIIVARITIQNSSGELVYKRPLWIVIVGSWPTERPISDIWDCYHKRFDIEHFFKFSKTRLLLVSHQTSSTLTEENWKQFCMVATHQLYHSRKLVQNVKKPWETKKTLNEQILSPSRVQRGMDALLSSLPPITPEVKPRGIPAGNKIGAKIIMRPDHDVIKKSALRRRDSRSLSINYTFKKGTDILKPKIKYNGINQDVLPLEIIDILEKIQKMPLSKTLPAP